MCVVRCVVAATDTFSSSDIRVPYQSKLDSFRDFLVRSKKYCGLQLSAVSSAPVPTATATAPSPSQQRSSSSSLSPSLIIIEEIPFIGRPEYRTKFRAIVRDFLDTSRYTTQGALGLKWESLWCCGAEREREREAGGAQP